MPRYILINWRDKTVTTADGNTANAAARDAKRELGISDSHPWDAAFPVLDGVGQLEDEWEGKKDSTRRE